MDLVSPAASQAAVYASGLNGNIYVKFANIYINIDIFFWKVLCACVCVCVCVCVCTEDS